MRHLKRGKKFGRERDARRALMKTMAASFFMHGRIETTEAKARALRPYVEKTLTRAKAPTLSNRRLLIAASSPAAAQHAIQRAGEMAGRPGGYTRIIKVGVRKSDSARIAILELVK
ncbi:MAG: 50S ribosomal protein L17 [Candidatus Sungbacteria bacterium RIFCSPLOWO2_02_FULL_54_10]|uniref:50S ribosomal protein L17 n=2 Tax=Candidatus Sungiibacteriota TaxID=1817917 RepID=A0A1G2L5A0_9BACT|nr:MAG: 50S ribosomal protein L17 [Candidatus Sungbacteria bacterium RIFCSPHIGHO2_01_FULL_54_26]OHA03643.1 MAG: 50S ribosomal protein L17 [Candidatus Sungbacteria bacterium RIFCSPHIGHO2_02_FULL_53_17]OHA06704.1 MAG: 50S ribosomal protein L17 [Candidatus Sungbacteria bacterium RIFCSPLOWO2_01_FULL_54_21]OHA12006.1 MAG: 50S ribosomal protein L17 [Candidatus Sungbacteria bacterium RIFCSPLOWO2_02_FULL_54_10]